MERSHRIGEHCSYPCLCSRTIVTKPGCKFESRAPQWAHKRDCSTFDEVSSDGPRLADVVVVIPDRLQGFHDAADKGQGEVVPIG